MAEQTNPPEQARRPRPMSPHLQVYRLPMAALLSISHRASGMALTGGTFVLVILLWAAATSPECFTTLRNILASPVGLIAAAGWTLALFYHLCAGIRHLVWDAGIGFAKTTYAITNWIVVGSALILTLITWAVAWPKLGF
jgi:succinate dehydrogenase / fumarate reductase cytochrome b subunit